jgi:hypothetical protein
MKVKLIILSLGAAGLLGFGTSTVLADDYSVTSSTSVTASTTGVCASQSEQVQQNGQNIVNRTDGECAP